MPEDLSKLLERAAARPSRSLDIDAVRQEGRLIRWRRRMARTAVVMATAAASVAVVGSVLPSRPTIEFGGSATVASDETGPPEFSASGWTSLPSGPLSPRSAATVVVTDDGRGLVWGGVSAPDDAPLRDGAVFNFSTRTWAPIPQAPITGSNGQVGAWTGSELIVWSRRSAAAFDPTAGTWRTLPEAPLLPRNPLAAIWTGEEFVVMGNRAAETPTDGAAYDPAANAWRAIAAAPIDVHTGTVAWTGTEIIVYSLNLDHQDELSKPRGRAAAWDPRDDSWRMLPPESIAAPQLAVWTGKDLLVLAENGRASAYDPEVNRWRSLANVPPVSAGRPLFAGALDGVALVWHDGLAAKLGPVTEEWEEVRVPALLFSKPQPVDGAWWFWSKDREDASSGAWLWTPLDR